MTNINRHPVLSTKRFAILVVGCLSVGNLAGAPGARAADRDVWEARVRCDDTGCLIASPVLKDSDGDGVSDADEIAAKTDPHDPSSRPGMKQLVDLAAINRLPSYAMTLAEIVVLPELASLTKGSKSPMTKEIQGVFDSKSRDGALTKLGIDPKIAGQITAQGAAALSIVATQPTAQGDRPPGAKANYMTLVSTKTVSSQQTLGDLTILNSITYDDAGAVLSSDAYAKNKDGSTEWETHCPGGKDCTTTDGNWLTDLFSYSNPDESGEEVDPRFVAVGNTGSAFKQVLAKLGSYSTPARIGGVDVAGADVAAVVAQKCQRDGVARQANTQDAGGSEGVCSGIGLYDSETGSITLSTNPQTFNQATPRTVQSWNPPLTNPPSGDPLGGGR